VSPSPRWAHPGETPLGEAFAAAQRAAWRVDASVRRAVFAETFRKSCGAHRAEAALLSALSLFDLQTAPPKGYVDQPDGVLFELCPRCQQAKGIPHSIAPSGRIRLNALRDKDWLERRFAQHGTPKTIAKELGCIPAVVKIWADRHGLTWEGRRRPNHSIDEDVRRLHMAGRCPGEISEALDERITDVRRSLARLSLANQKGGHHYFEREWWVKHLVEKQLTATECAKLAGIVSHNASWWIKKFGLQETTAARSCRSTRRRWKVKYPALADPEQLKALMDKHGSYEGIALEVCGSRHGGSNVRAWWLKHFGRPPANLKRGRPKKRPECDWWIERLDRGLTTWQLAHERGCTEHSVRETLRVLGPELLARGYRNNAVAEKSKRSRSAAARWARSTEDVPPVPTQRSA
jgi:hypothetical protein